MASAADLKLLKEMAVHALDASNADLLETLDIRIRYVKGDEERIYTLHTKMLLEDQLAQDITKAFLYGLSERCAAMHMQARHSG